MDSLETFIHGKSSFLMKNSLVDGDGFNLYQGVLGQGGYLERSTGGAIGRKVLCIHFVHGTKVGNRCV